MKTAIYARRASVTQQDRSIDARIRLCQEYAERHGGTIVAIYSDDAISGSHLETRPGVQKLLEDAKTGLFDTVITEGLDCLSRDLEAIVTIYKRLTHHSIIIDTVKEGSISERDLGSTGTLNAPFLRDLANKLRCGQEGEAKAERVPVGLRCSHDVGRDSAASRSSSGSSHATPCSRTMEGGIANAGHAEVTDPSRVPQRNRAAGTRHLSSTHEHVLRGRNQHESRDLRTLFFRQPA